MTIFANSIAGFSSVITLSKLKLNIKLGVGAEERSVPQEVDISFKFFSRNAFKGCETDDIKDTVCYYEISEIVKEHCGGGEFRLLEYLCHGLYKKVREKISPEIKIWVLVEKCRPPIENLEGVTSFEYSDLWE